MPGEPKSRRKKSDDEEIKEAVKKAIQALQGKISNEGMKGSVTDLVRLLQLRKELEGERPSDTIARWVDECENTADET